MMERDSIYNPGRAGLPLLRLYQEEIGRAVVESVRNNLGLTFSVEVARQGGKNELSAQLEFLLMILHMERGGNIIKCAPTFRPQCLVSMDRLLEKVQQAGMESLCQVRQGHILSLGRAQAIFYSAEPSSHVMGATAHILLEVDESQDVDKDKFSRDFKPMASTTNATTVLYGTTWDESSLLEEVKRQNLELERKDGIRRHFRYDWEEVARYNPAYSTYVDSERKRLGDNHPLFLTQYNLLTLSDRGRLFSPLQLSQMKGEHPRLRSRASGKVYAAGLDLAGLADADRGEKTEDRGQEKEDRGEKTEDRGQEKEDRDRDRKRDAAVLAIGELEQGNALKVVELLAWTGESYASLYARLVNIIKDVWNCSTVVVDATGAGAGAASFLKEALGRRVIPFQFTAQSKSRLGFQLLSSVNLEKVKVFCGDGSRESRELWKEMERARAAYRANQTMNFYVEPSEGHDDYLMALALAVEARALYRPREARGSR